MKVENLKCEIEFEIDGDEVSANAVDFKEEYPIEEDLNNLSIEDVEIDGETLERNVMYSADFEIEFFKSWTDCGYEYDSQYTIDNIKKKPTSQTEHSEGK